MEQKMVPYTAVTNIAGHRVVVLAPHPDDEVFGCGGAIMRHVAAGDALLVIVVSDGEYRAEPEQMAAYANTRREESRQAALKLGYGCPTFWGFPDRGIEYGEQLLHHIEGAVNDFNADLVYAPSIFEMHPDHRALGMAAVEAVRRHSGELRIALYEVGVPMFPCCAPIHCWTSATSHNANRRLWHVLRHNSLSKLMTSILPP